MKSSLILGIIFFVIGGVLAYIQYNDSAEAFLNFIFITGILLGAGLGLFFGAIIGYSSKAQSVKRKNKMQKNDKEENVSTIEDESSL